MTPIFIIIGLVLNGILAHIIGNVAKDRKIGYNTAFLVSFLLSPLIGLLLVIASVPLTEAERGSSETDKAPQTSSPIGFLKPVPILLLIIHNLSFISVRTFFAVIGAFCFGKKVEVQFSENGLSKDNLIVIGIAIVSVICLFLLAHLDLL